MESSTNHWTIADSGNVYCDSCIDQQQCWMSSWFCGYQGWRAHSALTRECGDTRFIARWSPTGEQCPVWALWGRYSSEVSRFVYWDFLGLLKGYELKLQIDDSVKPVAQPVHRILFGLRKKVEKKLEELLQADIFEEVPEGPTGWISLLVVVPKNDGDVRVCVDILRANEAIIRERHPISTVEELLHALNGCTAFSKVAWK